MRLGLLLLVWVYVFVCVFIPLETLDEIVDQCDQCAEEGHPLLMSDFLVRCHNSLRFRLCLFTFTFSFYTCSQSRISPQQR